VCAGADHLLEGQLALALVGAGDAPPGVLRTGAPGGTAPDRPLALAGRRRAPQELAAAAEALAGLAGREGAPAGLRDRLALALAGEARALAEAHARELRAVAGLGHVPRPGLVAAAAA